MIEDNSYRPLPGSMSRSWRAVCQAWLSALAMLTLGASMLALPWEGLIVVPLLLLAAAWLGEEGQVDAFPRREDLLLVAAMGLQGLAWVGMLLLHGEGASGLVNAWPFALAMVALVAFARVRVRATWLWAGLALGSLAASAWALWQRVVEGTTRANGHEPLHAILFGNLGLLMGLLCLAGLSWSFARRERWPWSLLLIVGGLAGLLTSALSGSRGGWIGLPLAIWVLYRGHGRRLSLGWRVTLVAALMALLGSLYAMPQTGVATRVDNAVNSLRQYVAGDDEMTSVSARLEMWRGSSQLILERPLLGWGGSGYQAAMRERGAEGEQDPALGRFWHAHNDILDAWVKRGVPGLLALLALYFTPLWLFARGVGAGSGEQRALAVAGTLVPVAFIDFGLTYSFLTYPVGGLVYALLITILWGLYRQAH
ncbi:O-antigen ligase family protein [Halomonas sp. MCCC 1A17488]|uniref:O-antigen ligase family protein n=1 Tax=Billgrantia sulfidoxydans TaxID=2733484 RepID=A0ABX7W4B1_9GAMM|nr:MULTISPECIES: O-antigen ligase family protein [Halomonas]MCE8015069.1 O-antigen ligase family protein [Halomonas sp. MCCC 1A17488]MCG3238402.1 O-antigen ligase family protein [Halomonas sp. MCCC 1A17488]QPP47855.1 O-antigen ligase family protein [Halomonas sp. SS10-MC5]QTP55159.1 O-antigen ligase family protein [Halomonas sulfidoxydans]